MNLFSRLFQRTTDRPQTRRAPAPKPASRFHPHLENLEARDVPSFAAPVGVFAPASHAVVTADVNGDGKSDLISIINTGTQFDVALGRGDGTFVSQIPVSNPKQQTATAIAVGDVNGDGKVDIVLANSGNTATPTAAGTISVFLGNGQGSFAPASHSIQTLFSTPLASITLAHVSGTSGMDLVGVPANGGRVYVAHADSSGTFATAHYYSVPGNSDSSSQVATGDLNGDGKNDVVISSASYVSVLLNTGTGALGAVQNYSVGGRPSSVALGDVTGDGAIDIVTANRNGTVSVLAGQGTGLFGAAHNYAVGAPPNSVALGDFNHDGRLDIVITGSTEMDVLLNSGSGAFAAYQKVGPAGRSVVAADFNGDGYADVTELVTTTSNSVLAIGINVLLSRADW